MVEPLTSTPISFTQDESLSMADCPSKKWRTSSTMWSHPQTGLSGKAYSDTRHIARIPQVRSPGTPSVDLQDIPDTVFLTCPGCGTREISRSLPTPNGHGARAIFYGLFQSEWTSIQHRDLTARTLPSNRNQADIAVKEIITIHHQHVRDVRKESLHGKDRSSLHSFKPFHLLQQVRDLYSSRNKILRGDMDAIFATKSLEERLVPHPHNAASSTSSQWIWW